MHISAILRILKQHHPQPKVAGKAPVEKFVIGTDAKPEETSGLKKIEVEFAADEGLAKPSLPLRTASTGQNVGELIRAVTKFEKSEESRVVDVFE